MVLRVVVPEEFRNSKLAANDEPESVRYTKAYEAFWWNCVMVKGRNSHNRCPFMCSGTPAATAGCSQGAADAEDQIGALLERFSAVEVQAYLQKLGSTSDARRKLDASGYFQDGPRAEDVSN